MKYLLKRTIIIILCVVLLVGDNVTWVFAEEIDIVTDEEDAEEYIETLQGDDAGNEQSDEILNQSEKEQEKELVPEEVVRNDEEEELPEEQVKLQYTADPIGDATYSLTYSVSNGKATITGYSRTALGDLVIPSIIDGYPVTSIGKSAFSWCSGLTRITIPDSVTSIGEWAFAGCSGLTGSLTIPGSVTSIGEWAFSDCSGLTCVINNSSMPVMLPIESGHYWTNKATGERIDRISNGTAIRDDYSGNEEDDDDGEIASTIDFVKGNRTIELPINWSAFEKSSYNYDNDIAAIALALSNNAEQGYDVVRNSLKTRLNCRICQGEYNSSTFWDFENEHPGYAFGYAPAKNADDYDRFYIVVRGTSSIGNIALDVKTLWGAGNKASKEIGSEFFQFAKSVTNKTDSELLSSKNKTQILITGHSLGGGIANLLASNSDIKKIATGRNTYIYTFAAIKLYPSKNASINNTYNLINDYDGVAELHWDCYRIGEDIIFNPNDKNVKQAYFDLTEEELPDESGSDKIWKITQLPHNTSVYMAAILTRAKNGYFVCTDGKKKPIVFVSWKCPVDVEIYDENGSLIGSVINNIVEESSSDNIRLFVSGDEKYAMLLGNQEYSFKMIGTDNGEMEYSIARTDNSSDGVNETKTFSNVELEPGKTMVSEITNDEDVEEVLLFETDENGELISEISTEGKETDISDGYGIVIDKRYTYTGESIKPEIRVYDSGKLLNQNVDYTISYANNINVAENTAVKAPMVTVKGKGNYTKSITKCFDILPKSIGTETFTQADGITVAVGDKAYTGKSVISKPTVKYGKLTLKENKDYTVSYSEDTVNPGTVDVTISAIEGNGKNYVGMIKTSYRIYGKNLDFSKIVVNKLSSKTYTGREILLDSDELQVYADSKKSILLTEFDEETGEGDYTVEYQNNKNVGTATVIIRGTGTYAEYGNSKSVTFKITPKALTQDMFDVADMVYTGAAVKPEVAMTDGGVPVDAANYTVSYSNNTNVAAATDKKAPSATIKGKGNYAGTVNVPFNITPLKLTENELDIVIPDIKDNGKTIAASNIKPVVKYANPVTGKTVTLKSGTDYTVDFTRDTGSIVQTAKIVLKGNYKNDGDISEEFKIYAAQTVLNATDFTVSVDDTELVYTGGKLTPNVTVKEATASEEILKAGKDYTVSYSNNVNAADKNAPGANVKKLPTVKITGKGLYKGTITQTFSIQPMTLSESDFDVVIGDVLCNPKKEQTPKVTVTNKATKKALKSADYTIAVDGSTKTVSEAIDITISGKGNYDGPINKTFRVYGTDIGKMVFDKIENQPYKGSTIRPAGDAVKVHADKKKTVKLTEGTDYVLEYGENVKAGSGSVTVKGVGEYGGTKTLKFTIVPKWLQWLLL